jgi:hypothetical protein
MNLANYMHVSSMQPTVIRLPFNISKIDGIPRNAADRRWRIYIVDGDARETGGEESGREGTRRIHPVHQKIQDPPLPIGHLLFNYYYYGFVHKVHKCTTYYIVQIKSIMSLISLNVKLLSGKVVRASRLLS